MQKLIAAVAASLAIAASCGAAQAQISDDVVKLGVLTDMSSLYADATGKGSLAAVEMAVADYGGKVAGQPIESFPPTTRTSPTSASISPATGTTTRRSTRSSTCRPLRSRCRSRR